MPFDPMAFNACAHRKWNLKSEIHHDSINREWEVRDDSNDSDSALDFLHSKKSFFSFSCIWHSCACLRALKIAETISTKIGSGCYAHRHFAASEVHYLCSRCFTCLLSPAFVYSGCSISFGLINLGLDVSNDWYATQRGTQFSAR